MEFRSRKFLLLCLVILLLCIPQATFAQKAPSYKIIAPELAAQGETFTGTVVEETPKGDVPFGEGDRVLFQGVVTPIPVERGGRIHLPAVQSAGSTLVPAQVLRASNAAPQPIQPLRIEILPARPNLPTKIAQAAPIISPGAPFRVTGQGLDVFKNAAFVGNNGQPVNLAEPIGSSLQQIYVVPQDLPKGTYRFIAHDSTGKSYEAPSSSTFPTLQISGPHISHRGQRGQLTVTSDVEGDVMLSGGEPQIILEQRVITVHPRAHAHVSFTAQQTGDYSVNAQLVPLNDIPVSPDAPRLNIKQEPLRSVYDPNRNHSSVNESFRVFNEQGQPAANVLMDVALAYPNGTEYARVSTDSKGQANFAQTLEGNVAAASLSTFVYHVPGHAWTPRGNGDPCCQALGIEIKVGGTTEGSSETAEWLDKLKEQLEKSGGEGAEAIGNEGSKLILGYKIILMLTRPWDIYATLGKGKCQGDKCDVKEKVTCRLIPRDQNGAKKGMPGGVSGSENEAWPPDVKNQQAWWNDVGKAALSRAIANMVKYCMCDDGSAIWPPPDASPVPACK